MLGREDQAADLKGLQAEVIEGKRASGDRSSISQDAVPGHMPAGKQVGDMKPGGL